jgi:hypothetical protein
MTDKKKLLIISLSGFVSEHLGYKITGSIPDAILFGVLGMTTSYLLMSKMEV